MSSPDKKSRNPQKTPDTRCLSMGKLGDSVLRDCRDCGGDVDPMARINHTTLYNERAEGTPIPSAACKAAWGFGYAASAWTPLQRQDIPNDLPPVPVPGFLFQLRLRLPGLLRQSWASVVKAQLRPYRGWTSANSPTPRIIPGLEIRKRRWFPTQWDDVGRHLGRSQGIGLYLHTDGVLHPPVRSDAGVPRLIWRCATRGDGG